MNCIKRINWKYIIAFIAIFIIEMLIALFVRDRFVRPYLGDVLVVILIYCLLRVFLRPYRLLPLWIFLFATAVEVSQYFNLVSLLGLENNRILSTVLGTIFAWEDILCYLAGCWLVALWQYFEVRRTQPRNNADKGDTAR